MLSGTARRPSVWQRWKAITLKEFAQLRRDRMTLSTLLVIPLMQLVLFGFAVNTDARHLPTAIVDQDHGRESRAIVAAFASSGYFDPVASTTDPDAAERMLRDGRAQMVIQIPPRFSVDLTRGRHPQVLVSADASDPVTAAAALAAVPGIVAHALDHGGAYQAASGPRFGAVIQRRYNPEGRTELNIVPALLGVLLMMSMTVFTSLAVTREKERGTMEGLLSMPVGPGDIMLGKTMPFLIGGIFQALLILAAGWLVFDIAIAGGLPALALGTLLFMLANLAIGYLISIVAQNQLQAVQAVILFYLPNMILSGFMFPFRGMPSWAQALAEALPLTHYIRLVRATIIKGAELVEVWPDLLALAGLAALLITIAGLRFKRTLD